MHFFLRAVIDLAPFPTMDRAAFANPDFDNDLNLRNSDCWQGNCSERRWNGNLRRALQHCDFAAICEAFVFHFRSTMNHTYAIWSRGVLPAVWLHIPFWSFECRPLRRNLKDAAVPIDFLKSAAHFVIVDIQLDGEMM